MKDGISLVLSLVFIPICSYLKYYFEFTYNLLSLISTINENMNYANVDVKTRRNGSTVIINGSSLLVGDIFELEVGMFVPADCLMIRGGKLKVNEELINPYERYLIDKIPLTIQNYKYGAVCVIYRGSIVKEAEDKCMAMVVAVG